MDEWKVDAAVVGTQKALMLPPGAAIVCVSQKALAAAGEHAKLKRAFFDFKDQINQNANGYFPYTPSVPMLYGLRESVTMLLEEGLENVFARHHRLAERRPRGGQGVGPGPVREVAASGTPTPSARSWCRRTSRART